MMKCEPNKAKTLVVIVGATASGKTTMAIKLAQKLQTEIISADSRQFYRELSIGTAKPTNAELDAVKHHFINSKSISETYSAGDFETDALKTLETLFKTYDTVVMVGGSGMYIDAVCKGFDPLPKPDAGIREQLISQYETHGIESLQKELMIKDPAYYHKADIENPQRLMRALEVIRSTAQPFSEFLKQQVTQRNFNIVTFGLHLERAVLYTQINNRVDEMIANGLEEEARNYRNFKTYYALRTVGYTEFFDYFDGKQTLSFTIEQIKQHTRNFAKRQLTWFRRNVETTWVNATEENEIFAHLNTTLNS